jgi:hypothetical protein
VAKPEIIYLLETVALMANFSGSRFRASYFYNKERSSLNIPPIYYIERVTRFSGLVSLLEISMSVMLFTDPDYPQKAKKKLVKVAVVPGNEFSPLVDAALKAIGEAYANSGTEIVFDIYHYDQAA